MWLPLLILASSSVIIARADIFERPTSTNETRHMELMGDLQKKLFASYSAEVRPVLNESYKTNVSIAMHIQHLEVDEVQQSMTVHGYLSLRWKDEFLKWKPEEYNKQTKIHSQLWKIWHPDINVYNSASGKDDWHISYQFPAWVQHDGDISVFPPVSFKVTCAFDFSDYPYDIQQCPIILGSFKYPYEQMDFSHWTSQVNFFMAWNATRWHINGWKIIKNETTKMFYGAKGTTPEPDPNRMNWLEMSFLLTLQRHAPYYHVSFLLPAVVTSFFTIFAFMLDTTKMQLFVLILCMISQGIFTRTLLQRVPPAAGALPKIVHYYGFNLSMTFIGVIFVLIFLSLLNQPGPVPPFLQQIYTLTNWLDPSRWGFLGGTGGGLGGVSHKKFTNEGGGDEMEEEKENEESVEPIPSGSEAKSEEAIGWGDIFEWLSRGVFVFYAIVYFLAMLSLLT